MSVPATSDDRIPLWIYGMPGGCIFFAGLLKAMFVGGINIPNLFCSSAIFTVLYTIIGMATKDSDPTSC